MRTDGSLTIDQKNDLHVIQNLSLQIARAATSLIVNANPVVPHSDPMGSWREDSSIIKISLAFMTKRVKNVLGNQEKTDV